MGLRAEDGPAKPALGEPTGRAIEEQLRYYDLRAPDYLTGAPSDRGGVTADFGIAAHDRAALIDELQPGGDVLELACGPGGFTRELARHARSVTAVDASRQMLARNEQEVARPNVRYLVADLFVWEPDLTYDVVFFGFFLSHVPPASFEPFWQLVRTCLRPGGRVMFVDEDDRSADFDEVRLRDGIPVARRTLTDGRNFDVVKVFWNADELAARLAEMGWDVAVRPVSTGLLVGVGTDGSR